MLGSIINFYREEILMALLILILSAPLLAFLSAVVRGLVLCVPVMLVLGWINPLIPAIPALGLGASFLLVMLIGLLIPTSYTASRD
jgi:hypothetical protein